MKRLASVLVLALLLSPRNLPARAESVESLQAAFREYSGARLVFAAGDLPEGSYHDIMPPLNEAGRLRAARIALREVKKLPRGYLGRAGLRAIGIFRACASRDDDGFHPYDEELKGYRYFGIYNGKDAVAGAYYTDSQLPLTIHHEIFHHLDATRRGEPGHVATFTRDERLAAALSGEKPYPAPRLAAADLAALKKRSTGQVLERSVSRYAEKSVGEDKAETARYLMSALPDALVQVATRPELPGSQRLLHVLSRYEEAVPSGPGIDWFVAVALGRAAEPPAPVAAAPAKAADPGKAALLLQRLRDLLAAAPANREDDDTAVKAREALDDLAALEGKGLEEQQVRQLVNAAADLTYRLLLWRIRPREQDGVFTIWGSEDGDGVNWTLRGDLTAVSRDARRLLRIAGLAPGSTDAVQSAQLKSLRLIARYHHFIATRWSVSAGTRLAFEQTRMALIAALPAGETGLARKLLEADLDDLGEAIAPDGKAVLPRAPAPRADGRHAWDDNAYLKKVDNAVDDPAVRKAIRRVQPACVRLGGGSGVNLSVHGHVLTAGHVPERLGARLTVEFPDGRKYPGVCTAYDNHLDLAIVRITTRDELPWAPLAPEPPVRGTRVVCIGQPGTYSPGGHPTGYQPFHVSTGVIRGFLDDPLGDQSLGRTKHDAWTYWGHSGSPLFDERGRIVALHNSWDSNTAMRHAVTHQAILRFLEREKVPHTTEP
jgi:S1-C subfamily serine protease